MNGFNEMAVEDIVALHEKTGMEFDTADGVIVAATIPAEE